MILYVGVPLGVIGFLLVCLVLATFFICQRMKDRGKDRLEEEYDETPVQNAAPKFVIFYFLTFVFTNVFYKYFFRFQALSSSEITPVAPTPSVAVANSAALETNSDLFSIKWETITLSREIGQGGGGAGLYFRVGSVWVGF